MLVDAMVDSVAICANGVITEISVPAERVEQWADYADEMGITQSEFIRNAVEIGLKRMDVPEFCEGYDDSSQSYRTEIMAAIRVGNSDLDAIVEAVKEDIDDDIRDDIDRLMETGQLEFSGHGGIKITETATNTHNGEPP